MLESVPGTNQY